MEPNILKKSARLERSLERRIDKYITCSQKKETNEVSIIAQEL